MTSHSPSSSEFLSLPRLELSPTLRVLSPPKLTDTPVFEVYQQQQEQQWKLWGTYAATDPDYGAVSHVVGNGELIYLGHRDLSDPGEDSSTPEFALLVRLCEGRMRKGAEPVRVVVETAAPEPEPEPELAVAPLPPSPPPPPHHHQNHTETSEAVHVPSEPVDIPPRAPQPQSTPTAESFADLGESMSESQYSNISSPIDYDEESDRWSEVSTGPVDRQWTVVFEEKEETV